MKNIERGKRWTTVGASVTKIESMKIEERAKKNGLSKNAYIKARLLEDEDGREQMELLSVHQKKSYRVLNKILALMNVLTKKHIGEPETDEILEEVDRLLTEKGYSNE